MRKNNKLRIGLFLAILFVFAIIFNCRTAKNSVQKSKEDFKKEELKINKIDSISNVIINNKVSSFDSMSWSNYMQNIDVSYSGKSLNDKLILKFTDNTIEVSGIGDINFNQKKNKGDSINNKNQTENINEQINVNSNSEVKTKIEQSKSKIDKSKENESAGPTWNVMIVLIASALFIIYLGYRYFTRKR
ncbi:hypothetical protein [Algoriella sp.]|uniref:hypothetical protein n=1 Tax=Algoriella sp. TaxID=1872434 RepID=UPI002FCAB711